MQMLGYTKWEYWSLTTTKRVLEIILMNVIFLPSRNDYLQERKQIYNKYRNSVKVVSMWLESTNTKFDHLPDIARELETLKNQLEQMKVRYRNLIWDKCHGSVYCRILLLRSPFFPT